MSGLQNNSNEIPRVSVGMPVYNAEKYLVIALDALLSQTFRDFEIVISDNGSTDATQAICESYARRDKRIRYSREEENRGVCWNFNRVFQLSRGAYFKWAAGDDVCDPRFLECCMKVLDEHPSIVCCHSRTSKIDPHGDVLTHLMDPTQVSQRSARSNRASRRFRDVLLSSGWAARSYGLIRSDILSRTSLIQPYYGFEKVLMAELALHGQFFDVPETLFSQRVHEQASSNLQSAAEQQQFFSPELSKRRTLPRLKLLQGYLSAIQRTPLSHLEKAWCLRHLARYLCQISKWTGIARSVMQGTGNGAAGRELKLAYRTNPRANTMTTNEKQSFNDLNLGDPLA